VLWWVAARFLDVERASVGKDDRHSSDAERSQTRVDVSPLSNRCPCARCWGHYCCIRSYTTSTV